MHQNDKSSSGTKTLSFFLIAFILIIGYLLIKITKSSTPTIDDGANSNVVVIQDNVQYINVSAKGGYFPNAINAAANTDTVLRVKTANTFDCSSAISIPALNYKAHLPPSGMTEIKIPPQKENTVIKGACSMGMYKFNINFK